MGTIDEVIADLQDGDHKRRSLAAFRLGELGANGVWAIPVLVEAIDRDARDKQLAAPQAATVFYGMTSLARIAGSAMREGAGADSSRIAQAILTLERLKHASAVDIRRWAKHWLNVLHRIALSPPPP